MSAQFKFSDDPILFESLTEEPNAKDMIKAYHLHDKRLKNTNGQTLKGLVVKLDDILELLEAGMTHIMILFAVSMEDVAKPEDQQDFTAILASVKNGKINTSSLRNKFKPCPSDCMDYDSVFPQ